MRTIDVYKRKAHWGNEIDIRDYKTVYFPRENTIGTSLAATGFGVPTGAHVDLFPIRAGIGPWLNDPGVYSIEKDIGFVISVLLFPDVGAFVNANGCWQIIDGGAIGGYDCWISGWMPVNKLYPFQWSIVNRESGTIYFTGGFTYIPKNKMDYYQPITWPKTEDGEPEKNALPPEISDS